MAPSAQRAVEISFAWFRVEILDDLPQKYRDMREHRLVTGAVTLPIVVKAFDGVL